MYSFLGAQWARVVGDSPDPAHGGDAMEEDGGEEDDHGEESESERESQEEHSESVRRGGRRRRKEGEEVEAEGNGAEPTQQRAPETDGR